jgi:hypothetical protein
MWPGRRLVGDDVVVPFHPDTKSSVEALAANEVLPVLNE